MKKNVWKRAVCILLAVVMALSVFGPTAFAADEPAAQTAETQIADEIQVQTQTAENALTSDDLPPIDKIILPELTPEQRLVAYGLEMLLEPLRILAAIPMLPIMTIYMLFRWLGEALEPFSEWFSELSQNVRALFEEYLPC